MWKRVMTLDVQEPINECCNWEWKLWLWEKLMQGLGWVKDMYVESILECDQRCNIVTKLYEAMVQMIDTKLGSRMYPRVCCWCNICDIMCELWNLSWFVILWFVENLIHCGIHWICILWWVQWPHKEIAFAIFMQCSICKWHWSLWAMCCPLHFTLGFGACITHVT